MGVLLQDIRYALRSLGHSPGFLAVVILCLALGIGANTAIFSVVNAVVFRPLSFDDPERLVVIDGSVQFGRRPKRCHAVTLPEVQTFAAQDDVLSAAGGFQEAEFTLTGTETPERVHGAYVTSGFFYALGTRPVAGRLLTSEEDVLGAPKVAVLAHSLWRRCFGEDASLIGQPIVLDQTSYIVVGILPQQFEPPLNIAGAEVFTPLPNDQGQYEAQGWRLLTAIGRLQPGVTLASAQARFDTIAARLEQENPETHAQCQIELRSLHDCIVGESRSLMMLLLGAAGLVLLIACADIANLLLARGLGRRRELAVRIALGAPRWRLVTQLLTESVMLGLAGGMVGLAVASWSIQSLALVLPASVPRTAGIGIDLHVFGFTLALSVLTGVLFGLPGALKGLKFDVNSSLKEGGGVGTSGGSQRLQRALVVSEVTLACVLLIGAGLLLRSFKRLMDVDPGFATEDTLTCHMLLDRPVAERGPLCSAAVERLSSLPGVRYVGVCDGAPFTPHGWTTSFTIAGDDGRSSGTSPMAAFNAVNPEYFSAMDIPLLAGRGFTEHDAGETSAVAVINETLARQFFPDRNPLGEVIKPYASASSGGPESYEIVGVVGSTRDRQLDSVARPQIYVPYAQHPRGFVSFILRTDASPLSLVQAVRHELAELIPTQAPYDFATTRQHLAASVANRRCPMLLLAIFAALAVALAAIGIYGTLSNAVSRRTHEIGVRMALGAQRAHVLRLVVRQTLTLTAIGLCIGLAISAVATRVLSSLLYEIGTTDPLTFLGVSLLLVTAALLASYFPARQATKTDPLVALRSG
ncbi:MAG: ABC transporter permease [Phycisphaerae bacterium]